MIWMTREKPRLIRHMEEKSHFGLNGEKRLIFEAENRKIGTW